MNLRECYRRIAAFKKAEFIPNLEGGYSPRTIRIWHQEGLPANTSVEEFFGLDGMEFVRDIDFGPLPGVAGRYQSLDQYRPLLEPQGFSLDFDESHCMVARKEDREYYIGHSNWGTLSLYLKKTNNSSDDSAEGAFIHLRGALQDSEEWAALRTQFKPELATRLGPAIRQHLKAVNSSENVRVLEGPSMVGAIALAMGFENYATKLYDDRAMIVELLKLRTDLALNILDQVLDECQVDMLWFWEDMAFRNGPYLSPSLYQEIALAQYQRLANWYRKRGGEIVALDSDGKVDALIPVWIKAGINHIWPLEPFAGMDVVALRKQYGQAFSMRGGIDKFVVAQGKDAIDRELDRICPVVQDGGYIPHLDHMLPHASFENYCYYMEQKKKLLGTRTACCSAPDAGSLSWRKQNG